MRQKNEGTVRDKKRTAPLILHWLLFFDTDLTEKLRLLSDRKILGVHMSVCVLNCTVLDVSFGERKKNKLFLPTQNLHIIVLYLLCSCSVIHSLSVGVMRKNDRMNSKLTVPQAHLHLALYVRGGRWSSTTYTKTEIKSHSMKSDFKSFHIQHMRMSQGYK